MLLSQLEYNLPPELIAHAPVSPRDRSKLMVIDRADKTTSHKHFYDLPKLLTSNDVLVFNQTKVFPARLFGQKSTGGKVEVLLLNKAGFSQWEVMGRNIPIIGEKIFFDDFSAEVIEKADNKSTVIFNLSEEELWDKIQMIGQIPLPPYIHSSLSKEQLKQKYQTVYAKDTGSIAAPTAGFHFTTSLLTELKQKGVQLEYITLHVGLGTFLPIKVNNLTEHKMHTERFTLTKQSEHRLNEAKQTGKRIISVGTTTTRVLESCASESGLLNPGTGETDIFIYPPYKFKFVDSLITNFHFPHSTLLALVSAFVSSPNAKEKFSSFNASFMGIAYQEAINKKYRFYSFGDSSIII